MAAYASRCTTCEQTVPAGHATCVHCGCPDDASGTDASRFRERYENSDAVRSRCTYRCAKCDHHLHAAGALRGPGGFFSAAFELASERFRYIACRRCGFTEFYRTDLAVGSQVADLLVG